MNSRSSAPDTMVPVGLLGLQTYTSFVAGETAARMAIRSWRISASSGTSRTLPPMARTWSATKEKVGVAVTSSPPPEPASNAAICRISDEPSPISTCCGVSPSRSAITALKRHFLNDRIFPAVRHSRLDCSPRQPGPVRRDSRCRRDGWHRKQMPGTAVLCSARTRQRAQRHAREQRTRGADDCPSRKPCTHVSDPPEVKSPIVDRERQAFRAEPGSIRTSSVLVFCSCSMRDLDPLIGIVSCAAACLVFWLVVLLFYWL